MTNIMQKLKKPLTNRRLSSLFFAGFIVFFIIFAVNYYTMNIIMAFICLVLSVSFKTWQLIKGEED